MFEEMHVTQIYPKDVKTLVDKQKVILLDCRTHAEHQHVHISGSLHVPLDQIQERHQDLPKDKEIIIYCHHGSRSMQACAFLKAQGFSHVANLQGGIDAWAEEVDLSLDRY